MAAANAETGIALRAGIARGEILVRYQPVVQVADRRPVMVEALARWHRPQASIPPDVFVPIAERLGLEKALSSVVAARAVAEMAPLRSQLRLRIALNLPLTLLLQNDLVTWLRHALGHSGLRPGDVALELTESMVVRDITHLHRSLLRLRRSGFRVLMDDLTLDDGRMHLLGLPFAGVKLDRSLVEQLPHNARARHMVRALLRHTRRRGQEVVAEGVSDQRLWRVVQGLGICHAQGYAISHPLPATALPEWHANWRGVRHGEC